MVLEETAPHYRCMENEEPALCVARAAKRVAPLVGNSTELEARMRVAFRRICERRRCTLELPERVVADGAALEPWDAGAGERASCESIVSDGSSEAGGAAGLAGGASSEKRPGEQSWHSSEVATDAYLPAGHIGQKTWPASTWNLPGGQVLQTTGSLSI